MVLLQFADALLPRLLRRSAAAQPGGDRPPPRRRRRLPGDGPDGLVVPRQPPVPALGAAAVRASSTSPCCSAGGCCSTAPSARARAAGGDRRRRCRRARARRHARAPSPGTASRWRGGSRSPANRRRTATEPALGPCLGTTEDLPALLADGRIDDILLVGSSDSWQTRLIDGLAGTRPDHTNVLLLPGPFESLIGRMRYRWVHDLPLIEVVRETEWRINWPRQAAARPRRRPRGCSLLASPVLAACALAVRATSPGSDPLPPDARRPRPEAVHALQAPHHAPGRRGGVRRGAGAARRPAADPDRRLPPPLPAGRAPAARQRPPGIDEPGRPAPRAPRLRASGT